MCICQTRECLKLWGPADMTPVQLVNILQACVSVFLEANGDVIDALGHFTIYRVSPALRFDPAVLKLPNHEFLDFQESPTDLALTDECGSASSPAARVLQSGLAQPARQAIGDGPGELGSSSSGLAPASQATCSCRGNCGPKDCKYRQNHKLALICCDLSVVGSRFCNGCKCIISSCTAVRSHKGEFGGGVWCVEHGRTLHKAQQGKMSYVMRLGSRDMDVTWSSALQFVARFRSSK